MYPVLLSLGDSLRFHSYAVFLSAGFLTAVLLIIRENYRSPNPWPITPLGGLWVFIGGLWGARLYYILQYGDASKWYESLYLWSGGLVFYGGAIGGFLGGLIYVLIVRAPVVKVGDLALSYVPLAHAIARIGCFLNGCCWGFRTDLPWGLSFPARSLPWNHHLKEGWIGADAARSMPIHATPLYESAGLLVVFAILRLFYKRRHPPGAIMLGYLFCYGSLRLVVEAFRGDSARHFLSMTFSQYVALGMIGTATVFALLLRASVWKKFYGQSDNSPARNILLEEVGNTALQPENEFKGD